MLRRTQKRAIERKESGGVFGVIAYRIVPQLIAELVTLTGDEQVPLRIPASPDLKGRRHIS